MRQTTPEKREQVLNMLRKDARARKTEIAKMTNVPSSTVSSIIKDMEKKLSLRYTSLLDYRKLGHNSRTLFVVNAKNESALRFISEHRNVNSFSRVGEDNTFLVETIFRGMKETIDFAEELSSLGAEIKKEFYIIDELKREGFEV